MARCRAPTRREKPVFSPADENPPPVSGHGQLRDYSVSAIGDTVVRTQVNLST